MVMGRKTIELTEVIQQEKPRKRSWKLRLSFKLLRIGFIASVFVFVSFYTTLATREAYVWASTKTTEAKYSLAEKLDLVKYTTKIVPLKEAEVDELVEAYCKKYGIRNTAIVYAMIDKESGGRNDRLRYEQTWKDQYAGKPGFERKEYMNEIEYDMLFTSVGLMQIGAGLHMKTCGLSSWSELLVPAVNIDCGVKILATCLQNKINVKSQYDRIWLCFRDFNGQGVRAENYANSLMARVSQHYLDDEQIMKSDDQKQQEFVNNFPEIAKQAKSKPKVEIVEQAKEIAINSKKEAKVIKGLRIERRK